MEDPSEWPAALPMIQWALNAAPSSSTGLSPHKIMYGMELPTGLNLAFEDKDVVQSAAIRIDAQEALSFAAMKMKSYYDKEHVARFFQPGDKVYLRLHKGYTIPLVKKLGKKFVQQYTNKFTILERVGRLAYKLDLPSSWNIHPVISVIYLEPAPKEDDPFNRQPQELGPVTEGMTEDSDGDSAPYEIERLLDRRVTKVRDKPKIEYLVRCLGWGPEHDVWYSLSDARKE